MLLTSSGQIELRILSCLESDYATQALRTSAEKARGEWQDSQCTTTLTKSETQTRDDERQELAS